MLSLDWT